MDLEVSTPYFVRILKYLEVFIFLILFLRYNQKRRVSWDICNYHISLFLPIILLYLFLNKDENFVSHMILRLLFMYIFCLPTFFLRLQHEENYGGLKSINDLDIWNSNVSFKIKFFTWLVTHDKILFRENLAKKDWLDSIVCVFCGYEVESS